MMGGGILVTLIFLVVLFLLIVAVVAVGVWLYRQNVGPNRQAERGKLSEDRPLEILRRRYASGEITREEFERMRQDLTK